ncbi:hypothetical protein [Parasitella parasitica]|uniref:CxC1-like cysteine cluster associated with KDZ transposases domain-containing protein n=1 Tax=Parasitella parasitica TaxID=35722 RepID=A0A0B7MVS5_9FUNG|nr:hypothetical protein [Parasitella parasitica]
MRPPSEWSLKGRSAVTATPTGRAVSHTVLAAITAESVVSTELRIDFDNRQRKAPARTKKPTSKGTVTGHYIKFREKAMDELQEFTRVSTSPYSPELDPIEQFLAIVKNKVKRYSFEERSRRNPPRLELFTVEKRLKRTYNPAARKSKTSTRVKRMLARNNQDEPKVDNTPPSEAFFNSVRMAVKWEEKKDDYVDAICNGLPLKNAVDPAATPDCTCSKSFQSVKCYFFFGSDQRSSIPTCRCRDLADTLLMMQMFPKTLINVKAAIYFGCLDLFDMSELRAQVSTTVFAEVLNQINMFEVLVLEQEQGDKILGSEYAGITDIGN